MTSTIGGNWKEFWLAGSQPGGGDIPLMQYHLDHEVDPNYQHPEMESTALCEAVTAGNVNVVKFLLEYKSPTTGERLVDPTIPAAYENQTPLQIAMELRHHEMVDAILEALPSSTFDEESQYCKTVLVTLPDRNAPMTLPRHQTDLITHILELGHRLVLAFAAGGGGETDKDSSGLKYDLAKVNGTGNAKFWIMSIAEVSPFLLQQHASKIVPNAVDSWISFIAPGSEESMLDTTMQSYKCISQSIKSKVVPSQILLILPSTAMNQTTREQLSLLFQTLASDDSDDLKAASSCNAMMVPLSWWGNLTYNLWNKEWLESISRFLLLPASSSRKPPSTKDNGNLYNHKLQAMPLPITTNNTGSAKARL